MQLYLLIIESVIKNKSQKERLYLIFNTIIKISYTFMIYVFLSFCGKKLLWNSLMNYSAF